MFGITRQKGPSSKNIWGYYFSALSIFSAACIGSPALFNNLDFYNHLLPLLVYYKYYYSAIRIPSQPYTRRFGNSPLIITRKFACCSNFFYPTHHQLLEDTPIIKFNSMRVTSVLPKSQRCIKSFSIMCSNKPDWVNTRICSRLLITTGAYHHWIRVHGIVQMNQTVESPDDYSMFFNSVHTTIGMRTWGKIETFGSL